MSMRFDFEATVDRAEPEYQQVWIRVPPDAMADIRRGMHPRAFAGPALKGEIEVLGWSGNLLRCRVLLLCPGAQIRLGDSVSSIAS